MSYRCSALKQEYDPPSDAPPLIWIGTWEGRGDVGDLHEIRDTFRVD
jgi:hypothetical protein